LLNRLYIVIGLLAILLISAAFVVPRFIEWSDYRERMQAIAAEVFGAPVLITGEIEFSLLPQPLMRFGDVVVGPPDRPAITVESVEAQFSLMDFIRDRYLITRLVLERPVLGVAIDGAGEVKAGLQIAERVTTADVSVASAQIVDGQVVLFDARTDETFTSSGIDGELRMEALRGPFAFQGNGDHEGRTYAVRFATSAIDGAGASQVSAFVRPSDERFSLSAEGLLTSSGMPHFSGTMTYRQTPRAGQARLEDAGRGDLVMTGKVQASPTKVLLSDYTVVPDENRAATRLQGAAEVHLGRDRSFNAVISGGVMALPPRDATQEQPIAPYELMRLLAELPLPPAPGLPGTVGIDIVELNLRAISLRDVRVDATADASGWTVKEFSAQLPGASRLNVSGAITSAAGRPNFSGRLALATQRLDALALLWRKPTEGNPLFNLPGTLEARLSLVGETLSVSGASLVVNGKSHEFSAEMGFGSTSKHLNVSARLGTLDARDSTALAALLPDLGRDPQFGATFPKGRFNLAAQAATFGDMSGLNLSARGSWEGGVLVIDEIAAGDLGGARFTGELTAFGSLAKPELSGNGSVTIASPDAPALGRFYDAIAAPVPVREFLRRSFPVDLAMRLDAPSGDGGQTLAISGRMGASELTLDAQLGMGFVRALAGPMSVRLDLRAADPGAMTAQLGLGKLSLTPTGTPMHLVALIEGSMSNSLETTVRIEGGADSLGFAGNVVVSDPNELSGNGTIRAALSDPSAIVASIGAEGLYVPAVNGSARLEFAGTRSLRLGDIDAVSGGQRVTGGLTLTRTGGTSAVSGTLASGPVDMASLFGALAGPAALLTTDEGPWPDGPLALGDTPRTTTGRVAISAPAITMGTRSVVTDARFELDWDATGIRLRDLAGLIGDGTVKMELGICCAGLLADKQVSGRVELAGVAIDALVPPAVARSLAGVVDAGARFEGTGDSFLAALRSMTGDGNYTIRQLRAEEFNPATFTEVAAIDTVVDMEPETLRALIVDKLDDGPFLADEVRGGFTIAGGTLRSGNLAVQGDRARLFGSASLRLADLSLDGGYAMSPIGPAAANGLVDQLGAQVSAMIGGTLLAPEKRFDVAAMVDAIMVRAFEIEVARLEQLRAEDEARRQAAAEERARLAEEAAKQAAADAAAKKAAEDAAAKAAIEAAARKKAEDEAAARRRAEEEAARRAAEESPSVTTLPPLNFTPTEPSNQF
jgi:hypothetical protein